MGQCRTPHYLRRSRSNLDRHKRRAYGLLATSESHQSKLYVLRSFACPASTITNHNKRPTELAVGTFQVIIGVVKLIILLAALAGIIYVSRFAFASFRKYPIDSNLNGATIRFRSTASVVLSNGV